MKNVRSIIAGVVILLGITACGGEKEFLVTIHTEYGDMHAILYDETPKHKENFIKLTREGFYDSLLFHRVMSGFMIQGGDPDSKNAAPGAPLGTGGPNYTIDAEFVPKYHHKKGALSAARQPDNMNPQKKSSGSQFFLVQGQVFTQDQLTTDMNKLGQMAQQAMQQDDSLAQYFMNIYNTQGPAGYGEALLAMKDSLKAITNMEYSKDMDPQRMEDYTSIGGAPHLDDEYTIFGQVIDGLDVIDKIAEQPTDQRNRPVSDLRFTISVEEVSRKNITKEYGYEFPEIQE